MNRLALALSSLTLVAASTAATSQAASGANHPAPAAGAISEQGGPALEVEETDPAGDVVIESAGGPRHPKPKIKKILRQIDLLAYQITVSRHGPAASLSATFAVADVASRASSRTEQYFSLSLDKPGKREPGTRASYGFIGVDLFGDQKPFFSVSLNGRRRLVRCDDASVSVLRRAEIVTFELPLSCLADTGIDRVSLRPHTGSTYYGKGRGNDTASSDLGTAQPVVRLTRAAA